MMGHFYEQAACQLRFSQSNDVFFYRKWPKFVRRAHVWAFIRCSFCSLFVWILCVIIIINMILMADTSRRELLLLWCLSGKSDVEFFDFLHPAIFIRMRWIVWQTYVLCYNVTSSYYFNRMFANKVVLISHRIIKRGTKERTFYENQQEQSHSKYHHVGVSHMHKDTCKNPWIWLFETSTENEANAMPEYSLCAHIIHLKKIKIYFKTYAFV